MIICTKFEQLGMYSYVLMIVGLKELSIDLAVVPC